jgi:PAS domain S-box-containing protein
MIQFIKNIWTASIKSQLILGIALVHAVMMSFFVVDLVEKERAFLVEQHNKKTKSLSMTLASSSTSWVLANDFIGLEEVVSSIKQYPNIKYIMVLSPAGQVLAHSNKTFVGKYLSDTKSIKMIKGDINQKVIFDNNNYIDVASPIIRDTQHIGWARIALSKDDINQGLYKVTKDGIFYTILAIAVGVLFAYLMAIGITKGIYQILQTIKKVRDGNYHEHSNLVRNDEIGTLSKEFDNMINVIEASRADLKEVNERHQLILDGLQDGTWDWDIRTDQTHFSRNWKSMLGYEEDDIQNTGQSFFALIHPNDQKSVQHALELHFQDPLKNPYSVEVRLKCKDDSYKWILARGKVILDDNDNPLRMLGFHRDISKEKETEQHLKRQDEILNEQSKNAAMGEMIGNIAHQWRQPLSIISSGATGMLMQKQFNNLDDAQFEKTCNIINDNAQFLSKTIDDFKNFIKGEHILKKFRLRETIDNFLNLVQPSFKRHNMEVVLHCDSSIKVNGYPNELIQCFMNIYNNAKDALKNSSHHQKYIFINCYKEPNSIVIKFKDNAGGIPEDVLPRIFEPYFTTKHQTQGTGLGLSMTYNLVTESMQGTLTAKNINFNHKGEFYKGAEFTITIPV